MYSDFKTISTYYDALYVNDREYAPEDARVKAMLAWHGVVSHSGLPCSGLRDVRAYPLLQGRSH